MSSLSTSIPGLSSGIPQPKFNRHFAVRFLVQANVTEQEKKEIVLALQALTLQTVSVKLPVRDLTSRAVGHSKLKSVLMRGVLELCLEDARGSRVADALEYLSTHPSLSVLVLKLDEDEKVCTAYRFNNAKATSYEHSLPTLGNDGESDVGKYTVKFDFDSAQFGSFTDSVDVEELF